MIQIASLVTAQGQAAPAVRNVMTLGTCAPIVGAEVMAFAREEDLLKVRPGQRIVVPTLTLLGRIPLKALHPGAEAMAFAREEDLLKVRAAAAGAADPYPEGAVLAQGTLEGSVLWSGC